VCAKFGASVAHIVSLFVAEFVNCVDRFVIAAPWRMAIDKWLQTFATDADQLVVFVVCGVMLIVVHDHVECADH